MSMTSESEEMMMPNNGVGSPPNDDANSGGGNVGGNAPLKKGPWTSAEDAILVEYVTKHGEGNWNAVQKHSGLARCGKSCRLRWANHLRPDLKKGAFTVEEERRIIELHAKMGNKWARMAAELPGRTDNEIKNYWNTRIKRRQRAGLPIYPADICLQQMNEIQQGDDITTFSSSGDLHHPEFMQPVQRFDIPDVEFKNLELNQQLYPPPPLHDIPSGSLLDIPASSLLAQGLHSTTYPNNKPFISAVCPPPKRLRGSETLFPNLNSNMGNASFQCQQNQGSMPIGQSFLFSSGYDYHQNSTSEIHASLNGNNNTSSSEPSWAMKLELPSLQTQMGGWGSSSPSPSSPLPFFEPVDILIQTPPTENTQSCSLSPQNSGLLDAVLYESETMKNSKSNGGHQNSRASNVMDNNNNNNDYNSTHDHLHETEWEACDERLSLGHSSSSVLSESTPGSGNSLDEHHSADSLPGCKVKDAASNLGEMQYDYRVETANQMMISRPDFLLASDCFGPAENYQGAFFAERCNRNTSW